MLPSSRRIWNMDNVDGEKGHMSAQTTTKFSDQRLMISICYNLLIGVFVQYPLQDPDEVAVMVTIW